MDSSSKGKKDSSPAQLNKELSPLSIAVAASPALISPSSDKRFWSALHNRVDTLLETRNSHNIMASSNNNDRVSGRTKRLKEDSMLLIRGFDSIASSLSQLTSTLDNAVEGARELAKPPRLTDIVQSISGNTQEKEDIGKQEEESGNEGEGKAIKKRKLDDSQRCRDDYQGGGGDCTSEKEKGHKNQLQKVKNLAVSMAAKSASLARELKSMKSDVRFAQERCALLEEENRRLRDGFGKGITTDDDDLVRLQLEALLAEKSRLATENANLTRENQCLRQLVEYHQFATQDLSASYEQAIQGLCLNFEEDGDPQTPRVTRGFELHTSLIESFSGEEEELHKESAL